MLYSPLYGKILFNEPLSCRTSMRAGGPARIWAKPQDIQQLKNIVAHAKKNKIYVFIIGSGCNIIATHRGIDAICVKLDEPAFKKIKFKNQQVKTGAAVSLSSLFKEAARHSLGGYEFLAGIPGTVGGAIFANAGTKNKGICDLLEEIEVIDKGGALKKIKKQNINFGYRKTGLDGNIIIGAGFKFEYKNKNKITALLKENLALKKQRQDYAAPSAGCIFKNPKDYHLSAGELIDRCGLKGKRIGQAQISDKHANFIINKNNARPQDILRLIKLIKTKVKNTYNIELEEEVRII